MRVAPEPCSTCPYRRDTPPGVWDQNEYEKLPLFDTNESFETFLCHQSTAIGVDTACRGWATVHCESVSVRLAMMRGTLTRDQVYADVKSPLYADGREAAEAGIAGIMEPSAAAVQAIGKLVQRGIGT